MAKRRKIPAETVAQLELECDSTCCMCREKNLPLQIHHINGNPNNNSVDNLVVLCPNCHRTADDRYRSRAKQRVLKRFKTDWVALVRKRRELGTLPVGMKLVERRGAAGQVIREYTWNKAFLKERACEAIEAARQISPDSMSDSEVELLRDVVGGSEGRAGEAERRWRTIGRKGRLSRQERAFLFSVSMAMGEYHFVRAEYEKARKYLDVAYEQAKLIRDRKLKFLSVLDLGSSLGMLGEHRRAVACFRKALRLDPGDAEAHYNLGLALGIQRRLPESIEELRRAVRLKPDHALAQCNLGVALLEAGNCEEAARYLKEAVRVDPDNALAQYNLGVALYRSGKLRQALDLFGSLADYRDRLPDRGEALCVAFARGAIVLAWAMLEHGQIQKAGELLARLRKLYRATEDDADIHGAIQYELGEHMGHMMYRDEKTAHKLLNLLKIREFQVSPHYGRYLREIAMLRRLLISNYRPQKIIAFGSCVKGDVRRDSDIDMLIVKNGVEGKDLIERKMEVLDAVGARDSEIKFEPIVLTTKELKAKLKEGDRFYQKEIIEDGWVIYEKQK